MQNFLSLGARSSSRRHCARWLRLGLLLLALVLTTGCSKKGEATNTVSGKVMLNDRPVSGIVTFLYSDDKEVSAPTEPDGSYRILNPPPGQVTVLVKPKPGADAIAPPTKGGPETPKMEGNSVVAQGVPPPSRYAARATSKLSYEVKPGKQTYDLPLTK